MKPDDDLVGSLLELTDGYRDSVSIFGIELRRTNDFVDQALAMGQRLAELHGFDEVRYSVRSGKKVMRIDLPEGITATVFTASGAIVVDRGWNPLERLLSDEADGVDDNGLVEQAHNAVEKLRLSSAKGFEELRFERLWKIKASGVTSEGERGRTVLARAVGAYRRYLDGLAVWGRASVFVQLAGEGMVSQAGVDWRPVQREPLDRAEVLEPEEAARRVASELQSFMPGGRITLDDYRPEQFSLGYLSLPKRRPQSVMHPVWVARFRPVGRIGIARLIVLPASETVYEPVARMVSVPPADREKPDTTRPDKEPRSGPHLQGPQARRPTRES